MEILIVLVSILLITGLAGLLKGLLAKRPASMLRRAVTKQWSNKLLCPICIGVSLTWLWLLAAMWLGVISYSQFIIPVALLMGGSVVGIAYQYAEFRKQGLTKLTWLIWMIVPGFVTVYGLLGQEWLIAGLGALVWLGFALYALGIGDQSGKQAGGVDKNSDTRRKQLEKELEECC